MNRILAAAAAAALSCVLCATASQAADAAPHPLRPISEKWLEDNDATALPALSQAAEAGDPEAMALLARSEAVTPPGGESAFYKALGRQERAVLLRAPGGLSGTSWMRQMARRGNPIAAAFLEAKLYTAGPDVVLALYQAGETAAAYYLVWEILNRGRWDRIQALPPDSGVLDALDYLIWVRDYLARARGLRTDDWQIWDRTAARGRAGGLMLLSDLTNLLGPDQRLTDFLRDVAAAYRGNPGPLEARGQLDEFAARLHADAGDDPAGDGAVDAAGDPNLVPLAALCTELCPHETPACMLAGMTAIGGYEALIRQFTPYEALIPQERFLDSPRARNTLLRRIRTFSQPRYDAEAMRHSACLADAVRPAG